MYVLIINIDIKSENISLCVHKVTITFLHHILIGHSNCLSALQLNCRHSYLDCKRNMVGFP